MQKSDHVLMRQAYEVLHGKLSRKDCPSRDLITLRMKQLEDNEPEADRLEDVTSSEDGSFDFLSSDLTADGRITVRRGSRSKGKLPRNAEELRYAHKLICTSWMMTKSRISNRKWLEDLEPQTFVLFSDFCLGNRVYGMEAKTDDGTVVARPPWPLVLSFEFEMRRRAMEGLVDHDYTTIAEAMKAVTKDQELK